MNLIFSVLFLIGFVIIGYFLFQKLNILDKPGPDIKPKRGGVPTMLGIFVYLGLILSVYIFHNQYFFTNIFLGLTVGGGILILITIFDELHYIGKSRFKIPPIFRLVAQILACVLAIWIGNIYVDELIIGSHVFVIPFRLFSIAFVLWSLICINAINWFDGINGQASGVSGIGFITIFLLIQFVVFPSYPNLTPEKFQILQLVKTISVLFFVASLISTIIEFKPIGLLRDIGTMFFGFSLAYLSVIGGAKIGTLVVALSLVIFDAIWVGLHRIFVKKTNPLKGDYNHLHYRLLGLNRNKTEVRFFVWGWSIFMMILMILQGANRLNKLIIFVIMALIFFGINSYLFWYKKIKCGLDLKDK